MRKISSLRVMTAFRNISNALDAASAVIRIFVFILVLCQAILLLRDAKSTLDKT